MNYQPIIGLEVHVELATKSKMFCGCPADHFGVEPNTHTCPVCLGLPGALPVPNKKAIEWTVKLGIALGCKNLKGENDVVSHFDRKNYFYPDLPKGYQITQYEKPFGEWGEIDIKTAEGKDKKIRIIRVHLEEDTGKLQHVDGMTLVDFNRSSVPLVEIVTEPDFRTLEEVDQYVKKLQKIVRYLGISNADMEKGSMRLEPSISIKENIYNSNLQFPLPDDQLPNYRVELKNINSFRFVRKALEYEIERQKTEPHVMQTRGWSEEKNATVPQREKEEAHDYRYFPEPDIPPIVVTKDQLDAIRKEIPELPDAKSERFEKQYELSFYQANILTEDMDAANIFEDQVKKTKDFTPLEIANSIINKRPLVAKTLIKIDEKELEKIINKVIADNQKAVLDYKAGKTQILGFLLGQIFKHFPEADKNLIRNKLLNELEI